MTSLASPPCSTSPASLRNWPSRIMSSRIGTSWGSGSCDCDLFRPNTGISEPSSRHHHRDGVDQHPHQAADDGAVDADELQVAADVQLDPAGGLLAVPALDGVRDHRGQLTAVTVDCED